MGIPLFSKSSSRKIKPSPTMAPASNTSSMEPHNGSASANRHSGHSSRSHGGTSHRRHSRHSGQPPHPDHTHATHTTNGGHDHYDPQIDEPTYNSAHTYAMYPPEEPVPVPPDAHYAEDQIFYPSAQFHTNDATPYDHEIRLNEDQAPHENQQYTSYPSGSHYVQTPIHGYYRPQSPVQQYPVQQHVSTSSTTALWSREQLAAERLRLGLPRYATQEEVEAARRAYEEATQQVDHSWSAPQ